MRFKHTHRPGFLLGLIDFCTAGLFFLVYMRRGLQDELDEILGRRTQRYAVAYLLGTRRCSSTLWSGWAESPKS